MMEILFRKPTRTTPFALLDADKGFCELSGKSWPVNADEFYGPLLNWLSNLQHNPPGQLRFYVHIEVLNIASAKRLMQMFYKLTHLAKAGTDICVHWYYSKDDEDMWEVGKDYQELIETIPFRFHTSQEKNHILKPMPRVGYAG